MKYSTLLILTLWTSLTLVLAYCIDIITLYTGSHDLGYYTYQVILSLLTCYLGYKYDATQLAALLIGAFSALLIKDLATSPSLSVSIFPLGVMVYLSYLVFPALAGFSTLYLTSHK